MFAITAYDIRELSQRSVTGVSKLCMKYNVLILYSLINETDFVSEMAYLVDGEQRDFILKKCLIKHTHIQYIFGVDKNRIHLFSNMNFYDDNIRGNKM